ncbi:MAG: hypothetical protein RLZZ262_2524 [Bacteroidota bacterium]|jgi:uncharacterized repeat protein (TIGR03806 family)
MQLSKRYTLVGLLICIAIFLVTCKKDEEDEEPTPVPPSTGVVFDINQVPYNKLSDYRFFTGTMKNLSPNARVLPYEPITPLFSDYAHKSRFVWMPSGVSATYAGDDNLLNFPDGTVLIKNFYYDHVQPQDERRILETRLMIRKNGAWIFADYIWNEEQTEATFSLDGEYVSLTWIHDDGSEKSVNFRIPSDVECFTCHKSNGQNNPIGPKPQNLNKVYTYLEGAKNQLTKWQEVGYLTGELPFSIVSTVDWTDESQELELRVRSYLDANCSYCHREEGHCYYRPLRLEFNETGNPDQLGVCQTPQEFINNTLTHNIARGNINRSVMYFRMNTTDQQYRMPLMGRTIIHEEAVQMMNEYISSLSPACN